MSPRARACAGTRPARYAAIVPPGNSHASVNRFIEAVNAFSTKLAAGIKALHVPPGDEATVADNMRATDGLDADGLRTCGSAGA